MRVSLDGISRGALVLSAVWAVVALAVQVWGLRGARPREAAEARGSAVAGAVWGFTVAMSPAHKESASRHPIVFALGLVLHAGVLAAIATVAISMLAPRSAPFVRSSLAVLASTGLVACVALLVRRLSSEELRELSPLDDYLANVVIALLLASALAFHAEVLPGSALRILAALLLLYLPLGKLRHALFCFLARGELAARLGLRGVYPAARGEEHRVGR